MTVSRSSSRSSFQRTRTRYDQVPLAQLLVSPSPRDALLASYLYDLTGSSLQSTEEVHRTAAALGVDSKALTQQIVGLKPLFVARNEIAHELDLLHVREKGDRRRRGRPLATTSLCVAPHSHVGRPS